MTFRNPLFAADGTLAVDSISSPSYQTGVTGWTINKDGTAEFNSLTVRGKIIVQSNPQGIFVYNGTPALGNLVASMTPGFGTDSYGNSYIGGVASYNSGTQALQLIGGTLIFTDQSYSAQPVIESVPTGAPSLNPFTRIKGPSNNADMAQPIIVMNGKSSDGTLPTSINLGGLDTVLGNVPTTVKINGVLTGSSIAGSVNVSFTSLTSFTQTVTFPTPFASVPSVHTNIASGAGVAAHWSSRAINVTPTQFTFFFFSEIEGTAQTWSNIPAQWIAIGTQ